MRVCVLVLCCASQGHSVIVEKLAGWGADVNARSNDDRTPIWTAVSNRMRACSAFGHMLYTLRLVLTERWMCAHVLPFSVLPRSHGDR